MFGDAVAAAAFAAAPGAWVGPAASPFGAHLLQVVDIEPGRTPPLSDVRDQVREDWVEAYRAKVRAAEQARLRTRYDVVIDWPDGMAPAAPPASPSPEPAPGPA